MAKVDRKKLLKQPDEFLTLSDRAVRWGKENSRLLIIVGSAAVVVLAAIIGIQAYISYRNAGASEALSAVFPAYQATIAGQADEQLTQAALDGLKRVGGQYGATPAGQQARLALGNLLLQRADYAEAAKVFQNLSEDADLPASLMPLALLGLGQALEGAGKFNEAAEAYLNAAKGAGPALAASLMLDQARALEASGDKAAALEVYRRIVRESKEKGLLLAARMRLAQLGVAPEQGPAAPPEVPQAKPAGAGK